MITESKYTLHNPLLTVLSYDLSSTSKSTFDLITECFLLFHVFSAFSTFHTHSFKYLANLHHFYIVEKVTQKAKTPKEREKVKKIFFPSVFLTRMHNIKIKIYHKLSKKNKREHYQTRRPLSGHEFIKKDFHSF